MLDVSASQVRDAAQRFLVDGATAARVAVIGPRVPVEREMGWSTITNLGLKTSLVDGMQDVD